MQTLARDSAYRNTQPIIDLNGIERFSMWRPPAYGVVDERLYVVTKADLDRPDNIAQRMYGTPSMWWVIMDYNDIVDPFALEVGDKLRIPDWEWSNLNLPVEIQAEEIPHVFPPPVPYRPPPFQRPNTVPDDSLNVDPEDRTLLNFGFPVPGCLSGMGHFQLQVASDGDFADVIISRLTATSTTRWFYYDPFTNNGTGGFLPFPSAGLDAATYDGQAVYFQVKESDGLSSGVQYYPRYKIVLDDIESQWIAAPPFIIQ